MTTEEGKKEQPAGGFISVAGLQNFSTIVDAIVNQHAYLVPMKKDGVCREVIVIPMRVAGSPEKKMRPIAELVTDIDGYEMVPTSENKTTVVDVGRALTEIDKRKKTQLPGKGQNDNREPQTDRPGDSGHAPVGDGLGG